MPAEEPAPRKRVRTGCLTCRGRKRKCDEARPICDNCKSKGLNCRYGVNVTFVQHGEHRAPQTQAQSRTKSSSSQIKFVPYHAPTTEPGPDNNQYHDPPPLPTTLPHLSEADATNDDFINQLDSELTVYHEHQEQNTQQDQWHLVDQHAGSHDLPLANNLELATLAEDDLQLALICSTHEKDSLDFIVPETTSELQQQYELELLSHYRYKVAVVLDLVPEHLWYGIHVMLEATRSPCIYKSVMALSACHRAATDMSRREEDQRTVVQCFAEGYQLDRPVGSNEELTRSVMASLMVLISEHPSRWLERLHPIISQIPQEEVSKERRPLLARLVLAGIVMTHPKRTSDIVRWFLDDTLTIFTVVDIEHPQRELQTVLMLLASSVQFLPGMVRYSHQPLSVWQSCWEKLGNWCTSRTIEMQEIFYLPHASNNPAEEERLFPFILFSNAYATVVNVVYHLTAMLLLQNKPRMIKASARCGSSTSSILHAQRLIGIADAAIDIGFWDAIVAVSVVHAAKCLSHHRQRSVANHVLDKIMKVSGMKLDHEISEATPSSTSC